MKNRILLLLLVVSALAAPGFSVFAQARTSQVGDFDLSKVRRAVRARKSPAAAPAEKAVAAPNVSAIIMRMILSLSAVLLVLGGGVFLFRKIAYRGRATGFRAGLIDVLETSAVMPGKTLALVRASDRVLLLGISQNNMQPLSEFSDDKSLEIIQQSSKGPAGKPLTQFSESLNIFLDKFKGK